MGSRLVIDSSLVFLEKGQAPLTLRGGRAFLLCRRVKIARYAKAFETHTIQM